MAREKVRVLAADESSVMARVAGDHGTYNVSIYMEEGELLYECDCPFSEYHPIAKCSHQIAVGKIWRPEKEER